MIAKKESLRLPGKNMKDFNGVPMFLWNLKKLVRLFDTVVFDSDCVDMCALAAEAGAHVSLREQNLRGNDVPSVPIFSSVINRFPDFNKLISLQANSPHTSLDVINRCATKLLMMGWRKSLQGMKMEKSTGLFGGCLDTGWKIMAIFIRIHLMCWS